MWPALYTSLIENGDIVYPWLGARNSFTEKYELNIYMFVFLELDVFFSGSSSFFPHINIFFLRSANVFFSAPADFSFNSLHLINSCVDWVDSTKHSSSTLVDWSWMTGAILLNHPKLRQTV